MSAIIRDGFKVNTLKSFITAAATNSLYLGIARPQFWDTVAASDASVPVPLNTLGALDTDWEDMLSLKKLSSVNDLHTGIFKEVWQANIKYDTYRHNWDGTITASYNGPNVSVTTPSSLSDVKCFVSTTSSKIYLCLKQSIVGGVVQPSIYSPDTGVTVGGSTTGILKTADGYYWKFMAETSAADIVKFSSKYYHPVSTITVAPAPSADYYNQWVSQVNSYSFRGGIYVINVLTSGLGYNSGVAGTRNVTNAKTDTEFKVIGDGTGLQYTVTYGASGAISAIEVTNPGTGYTHATITAATGTGAAFDVIFTPQSGLGADPATDLVARYLLASLTLSDTEGGDFTVGNDFRKLVLVNNPTNYNSTTIATAATLNSLITLNVGTGIAAGDYPADSIITGSVSGAKGIVVDFDTTTGKIRVIRTHSENSGQLGANVSFQVSDTLVSSPGTGPGHALTSVVDPTVSKYSGTVLYSEYISPIARTPAANQNIKIIVKF